MRRQDTDLKRSHLQIRAYTPGRLLINDQEYHESVILTGEEIITGWAQTIQVLSPSHFEVILTLKPDVLLLGTGAKHHFLQQDVYAELLKARIGVEVMSTLAACRTFNALILDGRHVVAGLII